MLPAASCCLEYLNEQTSTHTRLFHRETQRYSRLYLHEGVPSLVSSLFQWQALLVCINKKVQGARVVFFCCCCCWYLLYGHNGIIGM